MEYQEELQKLREFALIRNDQERFDKVDKVFGELLNKGVDTEFTRSAEYKECMRLYEFSPQKTARILQVASEYAGDLKDILDKEYYKPVDIQKKHTYDDLVSIDSTDYKLSQIYTLVEKISRREMEIQRAFYASPEYQTYLHSPEYVDYFKIIAEDKLTWKQD